MDAQHVDWIAGSFAEARTQRGALQIASPAAAIRFELTPRELEVLRHLAWRATDREIADALSISPRTVMHHVSHILAKLCVENRRDAAALAVRHLLG
jgi:DNA-binding NarL/FixJ family response regulator